MKPRPRPTRDLPLASALGRRDQTPNIALAKSVVEKGDRARVERLVRGLAEGSTSLRGDCIKTLYEIGYLSPALIEPHQAVFLALLKTRNQRMVWGAMTALAQIAPLRPRETFAALSDILDAAHRGSVIARDHAVRILIELNRNASYASRSRAALTAELKTCPANQFGMYCELVVAGFGPAGLSQVRPVIVDRLASLPRESQRRRAARIIRKT